MCGLNDDVSPQTQAHLLKGAAICAMILGGAMAIWGADKWIRYPDVQASQFGLQAPLWPAFVAFVLLATTAISLLFWTAARRFDTDGRPPGVQRSAPRDTNAENQGAAPRERNAGDHRESLNGSGRGGRP